MNVHKISFCGAMLVKGNQTQLDAIESYIAEEHKGKPTFDIHTHDGFGKKLQTMLYATKDESKKLGEFKYNAGGYLKNVGVTRPKGSNLEFLELARNVLETLYKVHISEYLQLPEKVYSAKEVLAAIKAGTFDAVNLVIKTAK